MTLHFSWQPILGRTNQRIHRKQCWITPTDGTLVGGRPVAEYYGCFKWTPASSRRKQQRRLTDEPSAHVVCLYWIREYIKQDDGTYIKHKVWKRIAHDPQQFIEWCVKWSGIEVEG